MAPSKRVAVISGGMTGIGLAAAKQLLADGVQVAVGARRAQRPEAVARFRSETEGAALVFPLDVTQTESVEAFVGSVTDALGSPDILVNAAGIYKPAAVIDHPDDLWDDTINANLSGTFRMIRAVMPAMKEKGWGRIINIASTAAHQGMEGYAAYCASKAGLLGLGRTVSLEGAPYGITCTSISPTWVETDIVQRSAEAEARASGRSKADVLAGYASDNPQGVLVQPEEVAALISFLASDAARAITMEDIQINAGSVW